jgi:F-type H+-transporting ATPase subunit alpha
MKVEEQVVSIYAGTGGFLDDIPVEDVRRFEHELQEFMSSRHGDMLETIRTTGNVPEGDALKGAIESFKETFQATEAQDEDDKEQGE